MSFRIAICLTAVVLLGIFGCDAESNSTAHSAAPGGSARAESELAVSQVRAVVQACENRHPTTSPAYTEREHAIYQAFMDTPMSVPEDEAKRRTAKQHGITPEEVDATVYRVQRAMFGVADVTPLVKCIADDLVDVKEVTVVADYAAVAYVERFPALNNKQQLDRTLDRMPTLFAALFEVPALHRVRLVAFYPATDASGGLAGEEKIATVEVQRSEFAPGKPAESYRRFTKHVRVD